MNAKHDQEQLLEKYVASFPKLDEMIIEDDGFPSGASRLATGEESEYGFKIWRPIRVEPNPALLEPIYRELPARFPPLYELLVLSYRWAEADLDFYRLAANPPGNDLSGLLRNMLADPGLTELLLPNGFVQFAKGPSVDYDPVCFDIKKRQKNGEFGIVKIDHEQILCNYQIRIVAELAPSFEQLIIETINRADAKQV
jgi:hypothetical protein